MVGGGDGGGVGNWYTMLFAPPAVEFGYIHRVADTICASTTYILSGFPEINVLFDRSWLWRTGSAIEERHSLQ